MPSPSRASSPSCPASGAAFAFLFAYHFVFVVVIALLLLAADSGSGLAALTAFLVAIAYLAGLVYLSVVSVLEDYKGLDPMRKSKALIQGKLWTAAAIFFMLNLVFVVVEVACRAWVVRGASHGVWAVVMLALVVQTVLYLVCKSYHHESNLSDRPPRGLRDYVPLNGSRQSTCRWGRSMYDSYSLYSVSSASAWIFSLSVSGCCLIMSCSL